MRDLRVVQEFVKVLLQWDYAAMFEKYQAGEGLVDDLPFVPKTFKNIEEYQTIFEKMIMEETLAELMQGSESAELITPQPAVITSSSNVAGFLEGTLILAEEHAAQYSHADLIVVDRTNPLDEENEDALKDHAVGHCDGRSGGALHVKFLVNTDYHAGNTSSLQRVKRVGAALNQPMSRWWVMRLGNVATLSREWAAVKRAERSPLRDILLTGLTRTLPPVQHLQVPRGLLQHLNDNYNASQYQALTAGLDGRPLVLIQGPPGTGKTHTILGLLSVLKNSARKGTIVDSAAVPEQGGSGAEVLLESMVRKWSLSAPWLTAKAHQTCARTHWSPARIAQCSNMPGKVATCYGLKSVEPVITLGASKLTKSRVLVCAPSNAALDEIVIRVIKHGLRDGAGNKVVPNIVRAGVAARMHASIKAVTLEALISQLVGESADSREVDRATTAILDNADMVFSTLAFSGGALFQKVTVPFDTLVIDEAAQALEPSCLVPLAASIKQVYMVGDPVQLPATVMSKRAVQANFQRSLFKRLQDAGYPVHVLQVQYRMHPAISYFASSTFYEGRIQDGPNVQAETDMPFHKHPVLGPLTFLNVDGKESTPVGSSSICNHAECDMVLALIQCLATQHPALIKEPLIGVISPYKSQVVHIKKQLREVLPETAANVDVNTIDGFQGREKDVIIFSTVRSVTGKGKARIGFVADERRINVGLTRARCSLIIVGHRKALEKDLHWGALVQAVSDRGALFDAKPKFKNFLQSAITGKVGPVRVVAAPKQSTVFVPSAEDDLPVVPSKRTAATVARGGKKRPKRG